jgi:hypothetical protein
MVDSMKQIQAKALTERMKRDTKKKLATKADQAPVDASGMPAAMAGKAQEYVGPDAANSYSQAPRNLLEQKNNELAQELLKKQQDEIKKKMGMGK